MTESNPHALVLEAWARVSQAVVSGRLDPIIVARYLEWLIDGDLEGIVRTVDALKVHLDNLMRLGRLESVLDQPIDVTNLSVRTRNGFNYANIKTIGDLTQKTESELMGKIKNFGESSLNEVKDYLAKFGLKLRSE